MSQWIDELIYQFIDENIDEWFHGMFAFLGYGIGRAVGRGGRAAGGGRQAAAAWIFF